ncbi:MAG: hypothetical protein FWE03_00505 [Firmicutes bacterium]|nr:hypothetical protein [Bacillota bacterium]
MRYLVAFRSRINAVRFYDEMIKREEEASLTSNRRNCGLAVKVNNFETAKYILNSQHFSNFCSIYEIVDKVEYKIY